jgi:cell wall-associated NlpC family hydrolase
MHARVKRESIDYFCSIISEEGCGLFVVDSFAMAHFIPCDNTCQNPTIDFTISPDKIAYIQASYKIIGICHSHIIPTSVGFSDTDKKYAEKYSLPLYLYHVLNDTWEEFIPSSYAPPFCGRMFYWGFSDCYSLLRDYYRQCFGIMMKDYPRDETSSWPELGRMVLQHIEDEGFDQLTPNTPLRAHDVLIFRTNGSPQHFAIFKGNSMVLHHPLGALSRLDQYNTAWQRRLHCVARYRGRAL